MRNNIQYFLLVFLLFMFISVCSLIYVIYKAEPVKLNQRFSVDEKTSQDIDNKLEKTRKDFVQSL